MQVDLDARIPPELYVAVAELLGWLHRLESGTDDSPTSADVPAPLNTELRSTVPR